MKKLLIFFLPCALAWSAGYNRYVPPPQKTTAKHAVAPMVTPPVSPMETNDYDITFEADFLWWTSNVTNLSYATKYEVVPLGNASAPGTSTTQPKRIYDFDWDWAPGVRIAFGINTNYDGWDVAVDWTYFYNSFNDTKNVQSPIPTFLGFETNPIGTELLSNGWSDFSAADSMATSITAEGGVQMNQVDLALGRNFWLSRRITLRPFSGVRAHFSHLDLRSKKTFEGTGGSSLVGFAQWNDNQKQKFWSVGIVGGFDSSWNIFKALSLFGSGGFSLCYGPFTNVTHYLTHIRSPDRTTITHESHIRRTHDQVWTYQQIIDFAIGFRIEKTWINPQFKETFRMMLDIGWEAHLYPSYNHLDQTTSDNSTFNNASSIDAPVTFRPARGNLSLSGFIVKSRFEF